MTILNLKQAYCKLDKDQRFYQLERPLIGITGGIATGKSSCAKYLISLGYPLIDADSLVKKIYSTQETFEFIQNLNPDFTQDNAIDFKKLRKAVFSNSELKIKIETYIYQRLPQAFQQEHEKLETKGALFYDIPLLFEKKLSSQFDLSVCVYTSPKQQLARLVKRDGISEDEAQNILNSQIAIDEKAKLADILIRNESNNINDLYHEIDKFLELISE